jgi:transcriptional regulator with XRE-family HTH domain
VRQARNLSLRDVQAETGLDRGYLSRIEREQVLDVGPDQVRRVAAVLRVDEDLIVEETNP